MPKLRRAKLKEWFSERPIPPKEKSYLSQLLRGKSPFGEKAARRLEQTYEMPTGFLDGQAQRVESLVAQYKVEEKPITLDERALVRAYRNASPRWRLAITLMAMVSTSDSPDEVAALVNTVIAKVSGIAPDEIRYTPDQRVADVLGDAPHVQRSKHHN